MKETQSLVKSLLAVGVILATIASGAAQTFPTRIAKVVRVSGEARYTVDGGATFKPLTAGTILRPGSVIQTAAQEGAYVDVVLGDGSVPLPGARAVVPPRSASVSRPALDQDVIRLHGSARTGTTLAFDKLVATDAGGVMVNETELDLRKGHITGNVKKMSAGSSYSIRYPSGVAAIRGSVYDMQLVEGLVAGTIKLILTMENGSAVVSFQNEQGQTISQIVTPLTTFDSSTGLVGPALQSVLDFISHVLATMGVPPVTITRILDSNETIIFTVTRTAGESRSGEGGGEISR